MSIRPLLKRLIDRHSLSRAESHEVMRSLMRGELTPVQIAAFLTALRVKGESIDEITGAACARLATIKQNNAAHIIERSVLEVSPFFILLTSSPHGGRLADQHGVRCGRALVFAGGGVLLG